MQLIPSILTGLALAALACAGCQSKPPAPRLTLTGTLNYDQFVVTPGCTIEVRLDDVSRADAPAFTIAREMIDPRESAPIPFTLHYDPISVDPTHRYTVSARIRCGGDLVMTTETAYPVLTQGHPSEANLILVPVKP